MIIAYFSFLISSLYQTSSNALLTTFGQEPYQYNVKHIHSAVLMHGHAGQLPGEPMLICVCCVWHVV